MRNKLLRVVFLVLAISLFFSGCWSRKEPKNLSITNTVLFDIKEDGTYELTKEIMKLSGDPSNKGGSENQVVTIECDANTVAEAVRYELNGKALFGGFLKARIFTENFAKNGMISVLDFLTRDHLTDETSFIVVVRDEDPKRIYSSVPGLSDMVGNYIDDLSKTQPKIKSEAVFITTLEFIKEVYADGKQPVAGLLEVKEIEPEPQKSQKSGSQDQKDKEQEKEYKLVYSGLAAFKDDRLVGYMDATQARSYNFVTNQLEKTVISFPYDGGHIGAIVVKSKATIKTSIENGQVTLNVDIKCPLSIIQDEGIMNVYDPETLKQIEESFDKQVEEEISAAIQKAQQEFQSDIFGFGTFIHMQHPKEWKEMKRTWNDIFSTAQVNVKVNSTVAMTGETKNYFGMED